MNPSTPQTPLQPYVPPLPPAGQGVPSGSGQTSFQPLPPPPPASLPNMADYNTPVVGSPAAFPPLPNQPAQPGAIPPAGGVKQELVSRLNTANNVLVTVTNNPSVDQLAAAIGLTLVLNKLGKHATAVFSGQTPSTIEFLQPEKTIEKNTDSLRDFIIALDKAKADKLRYKVEDKFVKIFITPYHTSLSESDLEFSQGDFNVDVVVALGVHQREELDQAITAHGRILHDAVTVSVNNKQTADLGAINWFEADASSLCEMVVSLIEPLQGDKALLDSQIATAFLTGVVAETERFSNAKTTPHTMNISATLMKAGANQQLVASKLEIPKEPPKEKATEAKKLDELAKDGKPHATAPTPSSDGSLQIAHKPTTVAPATKTLQELEKENKASDDEEEDSDLARIHIDDQGTLLPVDKNAPAPTQPPVSSNMILTPPTIGGDMSAATKPAEPEALNPIQPATDQTTSEHGKDIQPLSEQEKAQTLEDLERSVDSAHLSPTLDADAARSAAQQAVASVEPTSFEPVAALNASPIELNQDQADTAPIAQTTEEAFPTQLIGPDKGLPPDPTAGSSDPSAAPPVPPPFMPPSV